MGLQHIGEFEELVLLAICGLRTEAYAVAIQQQIINKANRSATMGAIYTALDRLEQKHFVNSSLGEITKQRGGRRKRFYHITDSGLKVIREARLARERLWKDIDPNPAIEMGGVG